MTDELRERCSDLEAGLDEADKRRAVAQTDAEELEEKCARQELQLAAYREALERATDLVCGDCEGRKVGCGGWREIEVQACSRLDKANVSDLLANPDGSAILARLKAGERLAEDLRPLRDYSDWLDELTSTKEPQVANQFGRVWPALAAFDKAVNPEVTDDDQG